MVSYFRQHTYSEELDPTFVFSEYSQSPIQVSPQMQASASEVSRFVFKTILRQLLNYTYR